MWKTDRPGAGRRQYDHDSVTGAWPWLRRSPVAPYVVLVAAYALGYLGLYLSGHTPIADPNDTSSPIRGDLATPVLQFVGRLAGWLFGFLFSSIDGRTNQKIERVWDGVKLLAGKIAQFASNVANVVRSIFTNFTRLIALVLRRISRWIRAAVTWLSNTLRQIFRPIIDALIKLRDDITRIYLRFVQPILDFLEAVRFLLRLLGSLGVEFARELDRKLRAIELKILAPLELFRRTINDIINTVNRIVTLDYFIQRVLLRRSLFRDLGWWVGTGGAFSVRAQTEEEQTAAAVETDPPDPVEFAEDFRRFRVTGQGRNGALVDEMVDNLRIFRREQS